MRNNASRVSGRKFCAATAAVASLSLLLAACSSGSADEKPLEVEEGATYPAGEMVLYGYGQPQAIAATVDEFLDKNRDIAEGVTFEAVQSEGEDAVRQRVVTSYSGGASKDLPDAIQTGAVSLVEMAKSGALLDVTDHVDPLKDDLVPGALSDMTIDGKVYALPASVRPQLLFYNASLFESYNIDPTEMDTMEGYVEVGRKLKEASDGEVYLSNVDTGSLTWRYWGRRGLMPQAEAKIWDDAGEVVIDTDPGAKLALGTLDTLVSEELVYKSTPFEPPLYDATADGKIATFYIGAFWEEFMRANLTGMEGDWRVMPAPAYSEIGTRGAPVTGMFSLINKPEATYAGLFTEWWDSYTFDNDSRQAYTERMLDEGMAYNPPVSVDMLEQPFWKEPDAYFGGQSFREMEGVGLDNPSTNMRVTSDDAEADNLISAELERYVAGEQTMDEAIAAMGKSLRAKIGTTDPAL